MENSLVSIIVPAYKQEASIKEDISNIIRVMSATRWKFEVIVVVDGFIDKTFERASEVQDPHLIVTGYRTNHGKGYAIRYGMARSHGDYVAFIDSGMDINPNGISMLLEHMEWYNADIIVGSKKHPVSKIEYPFLRKIYSLGYYFLVRVLFGLKLGDTQSGLKVYRRYVLEKVLPRLVIKKFAFDIEILAVAHHLGFKKIYEAPIDVHLVFSKSSFGPFLFLDKNIRDILYDTAAVFYRLKILRYYDDESDRKWIYNKELDMKVNTGEFADALN